MAELQLSATRPEEVAADVLVLAVAAAEGDAPPRLLDAGLPAPLTERLEALLGPLGVTGAADAVVRVPLDGLSAPVVALAGLGSVAADPGTSPGTGAGAGTGTPRAAGEPTAEALRRAAGSAVRQLAGTESVAIAFPSGTVEAVAAVAEGALLGAYDFTRYRSAVAPGRQAPVARVTVVSPLAGSDAAEHTARRARVVADAVAATRDLVNTPPVDLYPAAFAAAATAALEELPVTVSVLDEHALAEGGYGGILGVGCGSARPPRLVHLEYAPEGAGAHVGLVGKGITFDSGGLSIKPAAGMEAMKSDMAGAAAVLATVTAAARLALPVRLSAWLALAENMPSGTAQRPSDVLTTRSGTTVEVLNTDAEGRLVLADALADAVAAGPDLLVDVATLTGAQTVALGRRVSAIMSNDDDLRARVHRAAEISGEQFWPMPLPPELRASMDSPVADIANMGDRYGGMLVAGLFLQEFVSPPGGGHLPWAHLDIAGPAFNSAAPYGYTPVGGTGAAVRTLLALLEDVSAG